MEESELEILRYPIGRFHSENIITPEILQVYIEEISSAPGNLRKAVKGLTEEQLNTPYRPGGWTVKQVVHHLPDSHMNSYIRIKLALTEDSPRIKPYNETDWARLNDYSDTPVEVSLDLLESLHKRWVILLGNLTADDLRKTFNHPERGHMPIDKNIALYAWHGKHHIAQITSLRKGAGW